MRARVILLVLAILAVAAFAALNWSEFMRPAPLSFGATVADAPLGLIMLGLLLIALFAYLVSGALHRTQTLVETRHHHKSLEAQRDLADKAESSRFTDLRQHMDTQLRELRQRDEITATEFHRAMVESQRELRTQLEQMSRAMVARLGEIETRLDSRLDRLGSLPMQADEARLREEERRRAQNLEPPPRVRHPL
jgi:uncharacterized integral membrane protein